MTKLPPLSLFLLALGTSTSASAFCRTSQCEDLEEGCIRATPESCAENGLLEGWTSGCVTVAIHNQGSELRGLSPDDLAHAVDHAIEEWTEIECGDEDLNLEVHNLGFVECGEIGFDWDTANANVWRFRDSDWRHTPLEQGGDQAAFTDVSFAVESGALLDADVEINTQDLEITVEPGLNTYDLRTIVTHEMGHFLGLDHSDDPDSVMMPRVAPGEVKHHLSADDIAGICEIYNRSTPKDSHCGPEGGLAESCDQPAVSTRKVPKDSGCSVSSSGPLVDASRVPHHAWMFWFFFAALWKARRSR